MNPELSGQIRHAVTGIVAIAVTLGWVHADAVEAVIGNVMTWVGLFVGAAAFATPFYLSWRAKRPQAPEAKVIAAKVTVARVSIAPEVAVEEAKAK